MASERIFTRQLNELGDELLAHPGFSDWGEHGWFVSVEVRCPERPTFITPKVFFRGETAKADALNAARTGSFYGFPEA